MLAVYPTLYHDKFGDEITVIHNDGKNLRMIIRGVEFNGFMFDDFEPQTTDDALLALFPLNNGLLSSCDIDCKISIPVIFFGETIECVINAQIQLGKPKSNGGINQENIILELTIDSKSFKSSGKHGWFDDELQEIQGLLPDGIYIKSCYTCAFSDYHPSGYGAFGCLACFRNNKEEYLSVKNKIELMNIFNKKAESVQETYLCPEYEKRIPGTGYRG
jgi:hypothetical protein